MTLKKVLYRTRVRITDSWKKAFMMHPLLRIVFISLLVAQATPNTTLAQVKAVPPLSGLIGKVQSVTDSSIDVQTGSGLVHVNIKKPLTTYKQIPSDFAQLVRSQTLYPTELRARGYTVYFQQFSADSCAISTSSVSAFASH